MNKKYKILVIPSDRTGVGKFRSVDPHVCLSRDFGDVFDVDIKYREEIGIVDPAETFKDYDLIHIHKQLDKDCNLINLLKFLGKKVIVDVDDYWNLGHFHPMALSSKRENWAGPIIKHLMLADAVTTTTPIFAKEISKYNKNVFVVPNAIDPTEEQFIPHKTKSDRLRFGLVCGSTHLHDISLLNGVVRKLSPETLNKIQFVLCGFDTNGTRSIYHQDTGEVETRPIKPEESVWYQYEKIITDNYKIVRPEHRAFLEAFVKGVDYQDTSDNYMRYWTRNINNYATHYNNVDVLLAPLKECDFNKMKSQLKVIEAGFMDCAIIAQNFGAYTIDLVNAIGKGGKVVENGNALLVDTAKNHKQWAKYIERLANDRELFEMLKKNLKKTVEVTYSLPEVTKKRAEIYLGLLKK